MTNARLTIPAPRLRLAGVWLSVREWLNLAELRLRAARVFQNWRGRLRR